MFELQLIFPEKYGSGDKVLIPDKVNKPVTYGSPDEMVRFGTISSTTQFQTFDELIDILNEFVKINWFAFLPTTGPEENYPAYGSITPSEAVDIFYGAFEDSGFAARIRENGIGISGHGNY